MKKERFLDKLKYGYTSIKSTDFEGVLEPSKERGISKCTLAFLISSLVSLTLGFAAGHTSILSSKPALKLCNNPVTRKEWRALSLEERRDYVQAVNCLSTKSSRLGLNGTIYDDFAWVHRTTGSLSHNSSSFLPWHRAVLNVYEQTLKEECSFTGNLPYWDWTLDWLNLANSSIWDNTTGFGGDGQVDGKIEVGGGRCVVDGPFSGLRPIFFNHSYTPHCLSRGFRHNDKIGVLWGYDFRPEAMGVLMRLDKYDRFVRFMEASVHNLIHNGISGDFAAFTGSNDPLFFLHHAQLDRLWWQWQNINPKARLLAYNGRHMVTSNGEASLEDKLLLGGLTKDISVSKVMNSQSGHLCYRY